MADSWSCLYVENGPGMIDDNVRCAIKMAACRLFLKKQEYLLFETDTCGGVIQTTWEHKRLFAVAGFLFRTEVTFEDYVDYKVNFLISEGDLQRGAKLLERNEEEGMDAYVGVNVPFRLPLADVYQFKDLSFRGQHLN
ncbi:MAG TPA: hypothetical protein VEB18_03715 [Candidatus Paceibacterota bacterium]|nr:hypothetical protein [Candidatus Paceibacterota bacterium]